MTQRDHRSVDARFDRADHARAIAVGARDRFEEICRARLPVRARNTKYPHGARRKSVKAAAYRSEHAANGVDTDLRHVERKRAFDDGRYRAVGYGCGGMVVAVAASAGNATEQCTGRRIAAVVHDRAKFDSGIPSNLEDMVT